MSACTTTTPAVKPDQSSSKKEPAVDTESFRGRFGWEIIGNNFVPYIFRNEDKQKFTVCKIVEKRIIGHNLAKLHPDIAACIQLKTYEMTKVEAHLFNEINVKHSDRCFTLDLYTTSDLMITVDDAKELLQYVDSCSKILTNTLVERCGFIEIGNLFTVPFVTIGECRYVPTFYFEDESGAMFDYAVPISGWDLSYFKFCCKLQVLRKELYEVDAVSMVDWESVRSRVQENEIRDVLPPIPKQYQMTGYNQATTPGQISWTGTENAQAQSATQTRAPSDQHLKGVVPPNAYVFPVSTNIDNNSLGTTQLPPPLAPMVMNGVVGRLITSNNKNYLAMPMQANRIPRGTKLSIRNNHIYLMKKAPAVSTGSQTTKKDSEPPAPSVQQPATNTTVAAPVAIQIPKFGIPFLPQDMTNSKTAGTEDSETPDKSTPSTSARKSPKTHVARKPSAATDEPLNEKRPKQYSRQSAQPKDNASRNFRTVTMPKLTQIVPRSSEEINQALKHACIIQIADLCGEAHDTCPYRIESSALAGCYVPSINMVAYVFSTNMLVSVIDFVKHVFQNRIPLSLCNMVLSVLGIQMYHPNTMQAKLLLENNSCTEKDWFLFLAADAVDAIPQMNYMFSSYQQMECETTNNLSVIRNSPYDNQGL